MVRSGPAARLLPCKARVRTPAHARAGVILLSEELHRQAYNLAFQNYDVKPGGQGEVADWSVEYYDVLQNSVGGGKQKMHHYFGECCRYPWPQARRLVEESAALHRADTALRLTCHAAMPTRQTCPEAGPSEHH